MLFHMNRARSIAFDSLSWLLAGTILYLGAIRLATAAPWPVRLIGYLVLLVLPFALLQKIATGFGTEIDLVWIFLPIFLAGFIPVDLPR